MRLERSAESFRRWYALLILTLVYAFNIADRYVISTLIEPIKAAFGLSDSGVGFLTGTALAIVYTGMGIPLARLADRRNRVVLLSISIALWSVMTAACGMAASFSLLVLARIGVGLGEAGATPASQSILADLFDFRGRMLAMTVYAIGAALGSMLGGSVGGMISDAFGWRAAFLALALPSLALAPLVWFTIHEPPRPQSRDGNSSLPTLAQLIGFVRSQRALLHTLAGGTVCTFWGWGLLWWTPAFLARSHGFSTGEAGVLLALINGIGGTAGVLLGGIGLRQIGLNDPRKQCRALAVVVALATIASIAAYVVAGRFAMSILLSLFVPVAYLYLAPAFGWIQSLAPSNMRATFCAVFLFGSNIANLAIAPQLIGFGSDFLAAHTGAGVESLRWMLVATAFTGFWSVYHFWCVGRTFHADLERVGIVVEAAASP